MRENTRSLQAMFPFASSETTIFYPENLEITLECQTPETNVFWLCCVPTIVCFGPQIRHVFCGAPKTLCEPQQEFEQTEKQTSPSKTISQLTNQVFEILKTLLENSNWVVLKRVCELRGNVTAFFHQLF